MYSLGQKRSLRNDDSGRVLACRNSAPRDNLPACPRAFHLVTILRGPFAERTDLEKSIGVRLGLPPHCGGSIWKTRNVPLEFRGMALMDPPKRRIRFAGYLGPSRSAKMVICAVSVDALKALASDEDLSDSEVMGVFEMHKEAIFAAASAQYDAGSFRPHIELKDLTGDVSRQA